MNMIPPSKIRENFVPVSLLNFKSGRKIPVIIQSEISECGLACLAMISCFHGSDVSLLSLRKKYPISRLGISLKSVMDIAADLGFSSRAVRCEPDNLHQVTTPCILHWNMNHFVVLKKILAKHFVVHDPAMGERKVPKAEFNTLFTGVVLELFPTAEFSQRENPDKLGLMDFFKDRAGLKRCLTQIIVLSFILQVFTILSPLYLQVVVDDVLLRDDADLLIVLFVAFFLLLIIQLITTITREFVVLHLSNKLGMQISTNVFKHLMRLPIDYFSRRHMGDVVSRFGSISAIRRSITSTLVTAFVDGIMGFLTLAAMFFYNPQLTMVVILTVSIYAIFRMATYRHFRNINEEALSSSARESSHFMESVRAIQMIKIFHGEHNREQEWLNKLAVFMNKNIQISKWNVTYMSANIFIFGLENIVVIFFAAKSVIANVMTVGMLYAFVSYKARFVSSMESLIVQWMDYRMLNLHMSRLSDIVLSEKENDKSGKANDAGTDEDFTPEKITGKIEVKNLGFRFSDQDAWVFRNLNFVIASKETVAITGPSGSGKTTLLKCLMGLIKPTEGHIYIDDKPLDQRADYRQQIAAVMQDDILLSGDIATNIACFDSDVNTNRVIESAALASIHEDIKKLPMKYSTLVGDMGSTLSGGQKQRVMLARALYKNPKILFMDEATSHLDVVREAAVNENIRSLDITRVFVAHRPETVASAGWQIQLTPYAKHGDLL
ncbi:MAG TPA: peptidase domain-containing ABC transporter [Cellvibrio sp.]|nr:peptidase domain-containing ABC transporter [Cellvibrio sp.]